VGKARALSLGRSRFTCPKNGWGRLSFSVYFRLGLIGGDKKKKREEGREASSERGGPSTFREGRVHKINVTIFRAARQKESRLEGRENPKTHPIRGGINSGAGRRKKL